MIPANEATRQFADREVQERQSYVVTGQGPAVARIVPVDTIDPAASRRVGS